MYPGRVVLEIFSGSGHLARAFRRQGIAALSIDICHGIHHDVLNSSVSELIHQWIRSRCVLLVWLGTPCSSWSRARCNGGAGWPGLLRNNQNIMGLEGFSNKDQGKIQFGNRTMAFSASVVQLAVRLGIPTGLENPATSMLCYAPDIVACLQLPHSKQVNIDFCAFGTPWRKRTKLAFWHVPDVSPSFGHICSSTGGRCDYSGCKHAVLKGTTHRVFWTLLAQPYPKKLCTKIAHVPHPRVQTRIRR